MARAINWCGLGVRIRAHKELGFQSPLESLQWWGTAWQLEIDIDSDVMDDRSNCWKHQADCLHELVTSWIAPVSKADASLALKVDELSPVSLRLPHTMIPSWWRSHNADEVITELKRRRQQLLLFIIITKLVTRHISVTMVTNCR